MDMFRNTYMSCVHQEMNTWCGAPQRLLVKNSESIGHGGGTLGIPSTSSELVCFLAGWPRSVARRGVWSVRRAEENPIVMYLSCVLFAFVLVSLPFTCSHRLTPLKMKQFRSMEDVS
uniref:Uncharacterized protein n=1 Tax=Minutocellus polymorphus TaxID=265543 RepID=A0A7S0AEW7_9STRA|mmetsp:Transcript_12052/g.20096  ORF Transcript_12052/g.20096 Transcript_12052/m.20096 type:complete len:117 (+) Transcript_12052:79-429(+)